MTSQALSVAEREPDRTGGCAAVVFCLILLIFGAVGTYYWLARPVAEIVASRTWNQVPCRILSSEVKEHPGSDGNTYSVEITYRYFVDGWPHVSDRYDFMFPFSSSGQSGKRKIVKQYPVGSEAICFVDPAAPDSAVLNRSWTWSMLAGLFPLAFFIGGAVWLSYVVRRQPTFAPGTDVAISAGLAGALNQRTSSDQGSRPNTGPVELKSDATSWQSVLGVGVFAIFWNGIIATILFGAIIGNNPDWSEIVFITPFVLIGIGLVFVLLYYATALFNPVPILQLSQSSIPLGGTAKLTWQFKSNTNAVQRLRIILKAQEKATYARGTDSTTDIELFHECYLLDASGRQPEISRGEAEISIPADMMHSFKSEHNEIAWFVFVHGEIPWRPDVRSEFLIQVRPHDA